MRSFAEAPSPEPQERRKCNQSTLVFVSLIALLLLFSINVLKNSTQRFARSNSVAPAESVDSGTPQANSSIEDVDSLNETTKAPTQRPRDELLLECPIVFANEDDALDLMKAARTATENSTRHKNSGNSTPSRFVQFAQVRASFGLTAQLLQYAGMFAVAIKTDRVLLMPVASRTPLDNLINFSSSLLPSRLVIVPSADLADLVANEVASEQKMSFLHVPEELSSLKLPSWLQDSGTIFIRSFEEREQANREDRDVLFAFRSSWDTLFRQYRRVPFLYFGFDLLQQTRVAPFVTAPNGAEWTIQHFLSGLVFTDGILSVVRSLKRRLMLRGNCVLHEDLRSEYYGTERLLVPLYVAVHLRLEPQDFAAMRRHPMPSQAQVAHFFAHSITHFIEHFRSHQLAPRVNAAISDNRRSQARSQRICLYIASGPLMPGLIHELRRIVSRDSGGTVSLLSKDDIGFRLPILRGVNRNPHFSYRAPDPNASTVVLTKRDPDGEPLSVPYDVAHTKVLRSHASVQDNDRNSLPGIVPTNTYAAAVDLEMLAAADAVLLPAFSLLPYAVFSRRCPLRDQPCATEPLDRHTEHITLYDVQPGTGEMSKPHELKTIRCGEELLPFLSNGRCWKR